MSDNWIVQNLNSALSTWSEKMAELWTLLTENPATFKGGGIWRIMTNINDALTAIAYAGTVFHCAGNRDNRNEWLQYGRKRDGTANGDCR